MGRRAAVPVWATILAWGLAGCAFALAGCASAPARAPRAAATRPSAPATLSSAPAQWPESPIETKTQVPITPAPSAPFPVKVYFSLGEKVQPVQRMASTTDAMKTALDRLVAGPTAAERRAGIGTEIPSGTRVRAISIDAGVATVDLTHEFASGGGATSMTVRLAQIVYTATQFGGADAVVFEVDGKRVDVFGGEGIVLDAPQTRADMASATPAILVDVPAWGATARGPFAARGTADAGAGGIRLQLLGARSAVLLDESVEASSGTGARSAWSFTSTHAVPVGPARLRVWTVPKDGSEQGVLEIPITIGR